MISTQLKCRYYVTETEKRILGISASYLLKFLLLLSLLIMSLIWIISNYSSKADVRMSNRRVLKSLSVAAYHVHVLWLVQCFYFIGFSLVPHTALCLIGQRGHREGLVSSQWQAAFVCIKEKKKMVRNGPEVVICCWQTYTVLSGETLTCHCGLTAGSQPLALQCLFTLQVAFQWNSCS